MGRALVSLKRDGVAVLGGYAKQLNYPRLVRSRLIAASDARASRFKDLSRPYAGDAEAALKRSHADVCVRAFRRLVSPFSGLREPSWRGFVVQRLVFTTVVSQKQFAWYHRESISRYRRVGVSQCVCRGRCARSLGKGLCAEGGGRGSGIGARREQAEHKHAGCLLAVYLHSTTLESTVPVGGGEIR
jgi:hypothetical protein